MNKRIYMEIEEEGKESKSGRKKSTGQGVKGRRKNVLILKRAEEKRENIFVFFS